MSNILTLSLFITWLIVVLLVLILTFFKSNVMSLALMPFVWYSHTTLSLVLLNLYCSRNAFAMSLYLCFSTISSWVCLYANTLEYPLRVSGSCSMSSNPSFLSFVYHLSRSFSYSVLGFRLIGYHSLCSSFCEFSSFDSGLLFLFQGLESRSC